MSKSRPRGPSMEVLGASPLNVDFHPLPARTQISRASGFRERISLKAVSYASKGDSLKCRRRCSLRRDVVASLSGLHSLCRASRMILIELRTIRMNKE